MHGVERNKSRMEMSGPMYGDEQDTNMGNPLKVLSIPGEQLIPFFPVRSIGPVQHCCLL